MENSTVYALWLILRCGAASETSVKALRFFGSFEEIYNAGEKDFDKETFTSHEIEKLCRKDLSDAEALNGFCKENNIDIYTFFSSNYPPLLRDAKDPPVLLFGKGKMPDFSALPSLTVVGSRKCSLDYGKIASKICYDLSFADFITVTGVAAGADTFAKKGALLAGGKTVTVLPCGTETIYSDADREARRIGLGNGIILSEYLPHEKALRHHFIKRNRILAAISDATLVICAEEKSGTLITVEHARKMARPVFALPGSLSDTSSKGANDLIKTGATLCRSSLDIFDEYSAIFKGKLPEREEFIRRLRERSPAQKQAEKPPAPVPKPKTKPKKAAVKKLFDPALEGTQKEIYSLLKTDALSADAICSRLSLPFSEVITELQTLQFDGTVEEVPGGLWHLIR